ncbi:MAG: tetratricopeptide repeat protein [Casimicrobiaceae bacterium]
MDDSPVPVGARAFDVLLALLEAPERVVARAELLARAWPTVVVEENNLDVQVSALRKLLGADSITTVPRRGYRLALPVVTTQLGMPAPEHFSQPRSNVAKASGPLYGRDADIEYLTEILDRSRVVTCVGPGGIGKTKLALRVGRGVVVAGFPDGVWMVDLTSLADGQLVAQAIASALGVSDREGSPMIDALSTYLEHKKLLLILDNCEHLIAAVAMTCLTLLRHSPGLRILATSREPLGIVEERVFEVPPLAPLEAAQLFVDRASAVRPGFDPDGKGAQWIERICSRLDGMPLAIELAAACVRTLSLHEIDERLGERFRLLTAGERGALPRHRTLRGLIDWSYELLHDSERLLLRRLSVFAGGWTLEAAAEVCAHEDAGAWTTLETLTSLVSKSMVRVEERNGATRYRFLETIREYASGLLSESDEAPEQSDRHLKYFTDVALAVEHELYGEKQPTQLNRLETEHDNLRRALTWGIATKSPLVLDLVAAVWRYWATRGYVSEGRRWLSQALAVHSEDALARLGALHGAGNLARMQGDYALAREFHVEALALATRHGDSQMVSPSLVSLAMVAREHGDDAAAHGFLQQSLAIQRENGDRWGEGMSLYQLANIAHAQGDCTAARTMQEKCLAIRRELGDRLNIAASLNALGWYTYAAGELTLGRSMLEESLSLRRELDDRAGTAATLNNLAVLETIVGNIDRAADLQQQCLDIQRSIGDRRGVSSSLANIGHIARSRGHVAEAMSLFGQCLAIRFELGDKRIVEDVCALAEQMVKAGAPLAAATLLGSLERVAQEAMPEDPLAAYDDQWKALREQATDEAAIETARRRGRELPLRDAVGVAVRSEEFSARNTTGG